jgi:hypothetical protein
MGVFCFWFLRIQYWNITTEPIFSDMSGFEKIAHGIVRNGDYSWDEFRQSFSPPTLVTLRAIELRIFGEDFRYWQLFQTTIIFAGLIWLVFESVQTTKSRWLGVGLLWIVALTKPSIFWSLKLAREGLAEGFVYWCMAATLFALRVRHLLAFFIAGCLYTVAFLNRVNFVSVVPLVFLTLLIWEIQRVRQAQNKKSAVWQSAGLLLAFLLGVFVAWSPWLARSYKLYGNVVPLSTQAVFFWEMGQVTVHMPDGTEITTTHAEMEGNAPTKFRNDYEAYAYHNSLILPWLSEHWQWFINFVLTDRLPRTVLQRGEFLTKVSRVELFHNFLNELLLDKSPELIILGLVGLVLFAYRFSRFGILALILIVVPWFSGMLIIGVARMLDPFLPLILFGNLVWIAWIGKRIFQFLLDMGWVRQARGWSIERRLAISSLVLNVSLVCGLLGAVLYLEARIERQRILLSEGPRQSDELVLVSLSGKNYLFGIYDSSTARWIPVDGGQVVGQGKIYMHPDQKVSTLMLEGSSIYRQQVPADGTIFLRFYSDPSGGRGRVMWRGGMRELDLFSSKATGEWREIQIP